MSDIPNLLLVPSLEKTESLRAYMYKTAQANAHPRMYVGSANALKRARGLLGLVESRDPKLSQQLRLRLAPAPTTRRSASAFFLGEEQVPASFIRIEARTVCPLCVSETQWSRGEWELKAYTSCHLHGVKLVDRCDQCEQKLSWGRTELSSCYCGRGLAAIPPVAAQGWERTWAAQLHGALRCSLGSIPARGHSEITLSKLLLMADVVRAVLIPDNLLRSRSNDNPSRLTARLLEDPKYRSALWEAIFLYAAETPLLLSKMLRVGQSPSELVQHYQKLAENLPIPLALKPKLPPSKPDAFAHVNQAPAKLDIRSHVARLKQLYGRKSDESFDPFALSQAALQVGQL